MVDSNLLFPCKVCSSESIAVLCYKPELLGTAIEAVIYKCSFCSFAFSDYLDCIDASTYKKLYSYPEYLKVDEWARFEVENIGPGRSDILFDSLFVAEEIRGKACKNILIIGNGMSKFPAILSEVKRQCDVNIFTCDSHSKYERVINLNREDLVNYNEFFDVVLSAEVFEHFRFPLEEFKILKDLICYKGVIVGTTGGIEFDSKFSYLIREPRSGHVSFYSKKSASIIARVLRLQDYTNRASEIGHNSRKWRMVFTKY